MDDVSYGGVRLAVDKNASKKVEWGRIRTHACLSPRLLARACHLGSVLPEKAERATEPSLISLGSVKISEWGISTR